MDKRRKRKKLINKILIIILVLIGAIMALLVIEHYPEIMSFRKAAESYLIEDECGLVAGKLIHQIKDEGECKIKCRNECGIREEEFYDSEFILRENACHVCNCYCK